MTKKKKLYLNEIFDLIPSELNQQNKRFILKNLNEKQKYSRVENSFIWLKDAGVALPAFCAAEPKYPLKLSKCTNLFKLFFCDTGMLCSMFMNEYNIKEAYILSNENLSVNQNKVYIPVYMAMFLKNKKPDIGVYKIDLTALTGWKS